MRQLEVIAVSDDGTYVLLAGSETAARPTHQLRIDDRLTAAIRGDFSDSEPRESDLSPKEIQARLRAGDSVEEVAQAAGVPVPRVQRYAGPVISERDRVVEQARAARLHRGRGIEAMTSLGALVDHRLPAAAGFRWDSPAWDARRREDGNWIVSLRYHARGSRTAQWLWQPGTRELTSLNALGTRLGADDPPGTPRRRSPSDGTAARRAAAKRAGAKRAAKRAPAKRAAAKRVAAKRASAKRAPAKRAPATRAPAKRAAAKRAVAKRPAKPAPAKAAAAKRTVAKQTTKRAPATTTRRRAAVAPKPAPKPVVEPTKKRTNGRVPIPTWDDVLLGVQRPAGSGRAARGRRRS
jgi:hypothetical protein